MYITLKWFSLSFSYNMYRHHLYCTHKTEQNMTYNVLVGR